MRDLDHEMRESDLIIADYLEFQFNSRVYIWGQSVSQMTCTEAACDQVAVDVVEHSE